jgi:hypothetical protein
MRIWVAEIGFVLMAQVLVGQTATQGSKHLSSQVPAQTAAQVFTQVRPQASIYAPQGIVSDWTQRHVLYPESKDESVMERSQRDPRWLQSWYLRHPEAWWPGNPRGHRGRGRRDWSVPLEAAPATGFGPVFEYTFDIAPETGYGSLNATDQGNGEFLATSGTLTVTGGSDIGTYPLYPGGPGVTVSPLGSFDYDDVLYAATDPPLDMDGLLFTAPGLEINIWGNSPGNFSYYDSTAGGSYGVQLTENGTFTLNSTPGGGQTSPAKFVFDVNSAPSCANDYVVIGIPATPAAGGQANIVGVNNLYSGGAGALCPTGPTVMFAYASGTGQVPASIALAQNGTKIVYIENLPSGSSYFHVLTLGTTSNEGTSATAAVVPGTGGSNAVDQRLLLSPDGGTTNQSSTNAPFLVYTSADLNDVAYVTTYSTAGSGSGYLYKISNVFHGVPTIVWSAAIAAIPSTPVFDQATNQIFFTDSLGNIDYVVDNGTSASAVTSLAVAAGTTSENPVILDGSNQMIYATFNSNGTNALVVQAPTSLASFVAVPVGAATNVYTGPYEPDFNNAWYTGSGTPAMYVAGTGITGTTPTLYSIGFNGSGVLNSSASATTAALATGEADSSPITDFYNASNATDYLFVGVTNACVATITGGTGGCVMSLDITSGFPLVSAASTALAAPGGTTGIIVDNNSTATGASSIYYATKTGANLVKATQSGLN